MNGSITHLHVHSWYSLMEGTASVDVLIAKAKEYKLNSLALTDTNAMYGLVAFAKKAISEGIKPILGAFIDDPQKNYYIIILAKNREGFADLCKLITVRKLKENFSLTGMLHDHYPNLFIITPSVELLGSIPHYENIYAELIAGNSGTRDLLHYAKTNNIKYIPSYPVYFAEKEDYFMHQVVTAIKNRETIKNVKLNNNINEEHYFRNLDDLTYKWRSLPEALLNLEYIINNCSVDLEIGKYKFPVYDLPEGEHSYSYLWNLTHQGIAKRYTNLTSRELDRLHYELEVINDLKLTDYFLIVWDIVREAKSRGMMLIGRGSAANSIVSYCLEFTEVDPIKYNFYFERFLNKGRSSPPDVDLDFSWKERDQIVRYVFEKYGYERVAMISTHITFRARSAFRETAKAFGFSDREISKMSRFIPWTDARNLPHIAETYPEARSLKLNIEPWKTIVDTASRLANAPRHLSIHPSGIIVAPEAITKYSALEFAQNKGLGLIITQPDMYSIEDLGLIKIDLLSQRSLGVLRDTMTRIEELSNINLQKAI